MNQPLDTRDSLIAAGRKLFAERGFRGTSVRALTLAADANLGAITYHFGSKESFYHQVLDSALTEIFEGVTAGPGAVPALDRVDAVVRTLFRGLRDCPEVGPMVLREISQPGQAPPPIAAHIQKVNAVIASLITEGQRDGTIIEGDPQLLTLSVLAQPFHLMVVRLKMRYTIGLPAQEPEVFDRLVENATEFIRRGLARHE
jgi:AcrR family transcriptional regulator